MILTCFNIIVIQDFISITYGTQLLLKFLPDLDILNF